ncbi:hypothetical protein [Candidatus Leptofilum sp.]|uniref:hypothetical protein n=1 Tax=Candidatus Leptofilum sp. TaxID=3241576 RepID=UPI003B5CA77E
MTAQTVANKQTKIINLGLVLYFIGIFFGAAVAFLAIWGDLEASLFDALFKAEQRLPSLSCPVLITADEEVTIQASFTNRGDRDENLAVRARISQGFASLIREERVEFTLLPGDSETAEWQVSADDAAWDRVVMARVSTVRNAPYRRLVGSSCGILLLPFDVGGLSGGHIVTAMLIIGLVLTLLGGFLWQNGRSRPFPLHVQKVWRLILAFAGLVGTAVIASLMQLWLLGGVLLIILFLLLISATDSFSGSAVDSN